MSALRALRAGTALLIAGLAHASASAQAVSAAAAPTGPAQRAIRLQIEAGVGVGTLGYARPIASGRQILPDTPFAASELALRVHVRPELRWSLEALLLYQTSVGLELELEPLFGLREQLDVRTERVELSAAPVVRLAQGERVPALAFPIGFGLRAFSPAVPQYGIRGYQLAGPVLRAELWLPLGAFVNLRLGPEAQWLLLVDATLRDEGACCQGVAAGGQGALEAVVGRSVRVALAYRQAHASVGSGARGFKDVERFATLRIAGVW